MKKLLFLLLVPVACFAQAPASPSSAFVDALGWIDQTVTQLVTTKSALFLRVGWLEFLLFSGFAVTYFLVKTAVSNRRGGIFDWEGFTMLLGRIFFVSIFLSGYTTFHQLPMIISHGLSEIVTQGQLDPLFIKIQAIQDGVQKPNIYNVIDIVSYFVTLGLMALIAMVLFALNSSNYFLLGVLALFGPLAGPFLLLVHFGKWFFNWVGLTVSLSFMGVSIAAFTYVWTFFFMTAFQNTVGNNYSNAHFLALFAVLPALVGGFIWTGIKLGSFNAELFGGTGSSASSAAAGMGSSLRGAVKMIAGK